MHNILYMFFASLAVQQELLDQLLFFFYPFACAWFLCLLVVSRFVFCFCEWFPYCTGQCPLWQQVWLGRPRPKWWQQDRQVWFRPSSSCSRRQHLTPARLLLMVSHLIFVCVWRWPTSQIEGGGKVLQCMSSSVLWVRASLHLSSHHACFIYAGEIESQE